MKPKSSLRAQNAAGDLFDPTRVLKLASFLPYRLNVAATDVSEGLLRIYGQRFDIGVAEWRVLATLGEFRTMTAKAIGAHAHMGKVKVSRAVAVLEARGVVQRAPNADDMREAFLTLTPAGHAIYAEIAPLALDYVEQLLDGFAPAERELLMRLLDRLVERSADMDASLRPAVSR